MRSRLLPIYLPKDVYSRLEEAASAEDRDPIQHARWILKRALGEENQDLGTQQAHATQEAVA